MEIKDFITLKMIQNLRKSFQNITIHTYFFKTMLDQQNNSNIKFLTDRQQIIWMACGVNFVPNPLEHRAFVKSFNFHRFHQTTWFWELFSFTVLEKRYRYFFLHGDGKTPVGNTLLFSKLKSHHNPPSINWNVTSINEVEVELPHYIFRCVMHIHMWMSCQRIEMCQFIYLVLRK